MTEAFLIAAEAMSKAAWGPLANCARTLCARIRELEAENARLKERNVELTATLAKDVVDSIFGGPDE
jgi:hypothetical protein